MSTDDGDIPVGFTLRHTLRGHEDQINRIAWSPDGQMLASGSLDPTICIWHSQTGQLLQTIKGNPDPDPIFSIVWSSNSKVLASGSLNHTIRLWNPNTGQQIDILEGHTTPIDSVSLSMDGQLLASKSRGGTVRLWNISTRKEVAILQERGRVSEEWLSGLAFHSTSPTLATLGEKNTVIRIWDLDIPTILQNADKTPSVHYTNAKVVLVGDSGVGKTGLSLVLNKRPFAPTESTHGRRVWPFDTRRVTRGGKVKETRETLMWDLAGQPGYRLSHQLHLSDVAVTLVVFDAHSETDPFAEVDHWVRALNMAQRVQGSAALPMKKFLVAARIDRGGKSVSRERIEAVVQELGFDGYFETSAKEGINIAELIKAIKQAIDWHALPKVTSTALFQRIKVFLVAEKKARRLLSTVDDLYRAFLKSKKAPEETEELRAQFETCGGLQGNGIGVVIHSFGEIWYCDISVRD